MDDEAAIRQKIAAIKAKIEAKPEDKLYRKRLAKEACTALRPLKYDFTKIIHFLKFKIEYAHQNRRSQYCILKVWY